MPILPGWYADTGPVEIYFLQSRLLPAKTRAFVDFIVTAFRRDKLAEQLLATGGYGVTTPAEAAVPPSRLAVTVPTIWLDTAGAASHG